MLSGLGLRPLPEGVVRNFIGQGITRLVERCLAESGLPLACAQLEPALRSFGDHYRAVNGRSSRPFPGVMEGLARLRDADLKLACVTNKAQAFTAPLLETSGVAPFLDAVITADQLGKRKPDPAICLHACRLLQVRPAETVVVGDSANDADSGRAAGCRVVLVTYGYSEGRDVRDLGADDVVDTFSAAVGLAIA